MRGFSLLEVLVAFVILALVATALFRLFSGALANASAAEEYSRAVLVAESAARGGRVGAAACARRTRARHGRRRAACNGSRASRRTRRPTLDPTSTRASEALAMRLFRVRVDVEFPAPAAARRTLALATVRIGPRNRGMTLAVHARARPLSAASR